MADTVNVKPTGAALGADIEGVDLTRPIDGAAFATIQAAWRDHLVLRFRGQTLDDDAFAAFSARFGVLDMAPISTTGQPFNPDRPEIAVISNIVEQGKAKGGLGNSELVWHQDMSYKDLPPMASLLYGIETPKEGGETFFYNLYAAYEALPPALRTRIDGLTCKHDATRNSSGQLRHGFEAEYANATRPGAVHPLAIRHPVSGRTALYLGRRPNAWIVGLDDAESAALLDELWAHIERHDFSWATEWLPGDLVIWDNRCTLHRRNQLDPALRRLMRRTQVKDTARPVAA